MKTKILLISVSLLAVMTLGYVWGRHSVPVHNCDCGDEFYTDGDATVEFILRNQDQYCFSSWAPHGGLWNIACYDTLAECSESLSADKNVGVRVNTDECYHPEMVSAWCVRGIQLGVRRPYDFDDGEYDVLKTVCTHTYEQCNQMRQYQHPKFQKYECLGQMVMTRPWEMSYLTTEQEINEIISNNSK